MKAVLLGLALVFCGHQAMAEFVFTSASVDVHADTGIVDFSITFNQVPDFTLDSERRPANSFAFWLAADPHDPRPLLNFDTASGVGFQNQPTDHVTVYNHLEDTVLATPSYTLIDKTITFSVPLDTLFVSPNNGEFSYVVASYQIGITKFVYGSTLPTPPPSVPEPTSLVLCGLGLSGVLISRRRWRP